ncbi:hypothetical protein SAMN04487783_0970 [Agrococcus baldri]|uniref:Uncharacterized protein n=1 Tax=Agrococcus baldri TaxID=153730 RepID=A0AA94KZ43_9MICO|nr:hypothetical protein [Agrococcus baldri]SFS07517.1 hypothetical protein SAMN04487783_0970 [Agrococcus baldri]
MTELPWVIDTRAKTRRRNPVWGILALVAAALCGASFLLAIGVSWIDLDGLVVWLLPVWGIITLLGLAFAITASVKRGSANLTMAAIAGGLLVISNPVVFLIIGFALGLLQ